MARHRVAANLLMLVLLVGGALFATRVTQEVFPEVSLDRVVVRVAYPGASPEEVEEGVILSVEEAVRDVDGVEEVTATAAEGTGQVVIELRSGTDQNRALSDVKSEVDAIQSFPEDAERPIVSLATNRREVLSLIVYGDVERQDLRHAAERTRSALLRDDRITQVEVTGLPPPEIRIEVPLEEQRRHGLSLVDVASRVRRGSIDLPGGGVDTRGGEVLVRTGEKKERADEFRALTLYARPDGTEVTVGDVAQVIDGFRDTDVEAYFDGQPAARIRVFRVGDQTPTEVSAAVHEHLESTSLSPRIGRAVWNDQSQIYDDRVSLLLENAALGAGLVVLLLGVFLDPRLAFWVTLGIPISFLGAILAMPALGVSINMISLFAFILTLGIVVDDAIVVGEAVFTARRAGASGVEAAIAGVREVRAPITFAVLTTITAFVPLLFVPGVTGKFFDNIPMVVIPILVLSLVECFFVLPAHLAHQRAAPPQGGALRWVMQRQNRVSEALERFVDGPFARLSEALVRRRYLTLSVATAVMVVVFGLVAGGHVRFRFFPDIEGDVVRASLRLPFGAPLADTRAAVDRVSTAIEDVDADAGGGLVDAIYAEVGTPGRTDSSSVGDPAARGSHVASVQVQLVPAADRTTRASSLVDRWRDRVGAIPGVDRLDFAYSVGPPTGAPVAVELSHDDPRLLEEAAGKLAERLEAIGGVIEVDDGHSAGKPQIELTLRPGARALGLDASGLAQQVRAAFFGAEALRQQRGRHELRVYVQRPESERASVNDIRSLMVFTEDGGEIPLGRAARGQWSRSPTSIERRGGRRVLTVTGDLATGAPTGSAILRRLEDDVLPTLTSRYPGLSWSVAGEQEEQAESLGALRSNMLLALIAMFALMAIAFDSYTQPILLLIAIPFGAVGAILGHVLMGYDLSIISVLGMVALSGVVVNDSLVLVSAANDLRDEGAPPEEALVGAMGRRFRPILLTSLTTFLGLAPMIFETSVQARFLIPMALSLGFGVLFVTLIALAVVPATYLVFVDIGGSFGRLRRWLTDQSASSSAAEGSP